MTALAPGREGRRIRGVTPLGLFVLAGAAVAPDTLLWAALVTAGLAGLALTGGVAGRARARLAAERAITPEAQPALVRACGACTSAVLQRA